MQFPITWNDPTAVARAFTYATRTGLGPAAGSRPIAWYQLHQCAALDLLELEARIACGVLDNTPVRVHLHAGVFQATAGHGWKDCGRPRDLYARADRRARS